MVKGLLNSILDSEACEAGSTVFPLRKSVSLIVPLEGDLTDGLLAFCEGAAGASSSATAVS